VVINIGRGPKITKEASSNDLNNFSSTIATLSRLSTRTKLFKVNAIHIMHQEEVALHPKVIPSSNISTVSIREFLNNLGTTTRCLPQ
jgi:hypothetical protein